MRELLRTDRFDGPDHTYTLRMFATERTDWRGQTVIAYEFTREGDESPLFEGADFAGSPLHSDDADESMLDLMGFLTLRPGDTDSEYFDSYTADQLEFAESWDCESLAVGGRRATRCSRSRVAKPGQRNWRHWAYVRWSVI